MTGLETASPTTQLRELRELAGHADVLGGQLASHGVGVPSEAVSQAYQFFELAEALAARDVEVVRRP